MTIKSKHNMRGVTVLNLLVAAIVIVFAVTLAVRLVPPYLNSFAVRDAIKEMAADPNLTTYSKAKMKDMFTRKLQVNYIGNISPDSLVLEKKDGVPYLKMKYEVRLHLIGNMVAVLLFDEEEKVGAGNS
ncbi:MAG: DUF4845 domain-containing protein [Candidatus Berkiella sp.]